ncbi:2-C-methyl-D-erythritol 4-phosphate cytidylyltransferase [Aceticella autotrophica]|uniref:2-C-methyl-D-erythritol 4-phosphate cytidylyltransferase n=1 Tax=Aceticella autotrophica TaxID=2755338 RepID=A0A975AXS8_9THEO|nr:2-C-methyl-D-erythritol 4-phosphate cytidylyltransferase [Aceticella autotrophica]QSZ28440.1 2-C-methyl-D-erythritol 4-phosphate cytidylyltransferase [Aceticella autotrophica]
MYISAVIVAGGKGRRMGSSINKIFLDLNGKPLLYYSIKAFEGIPEIDEIIVVSSKEEMKHCQIEVIKKFGLNKVKRIVEGGKERQASVYNGLMAVDKRCEIVLIHDGARPFISRSIITKGIKEAKIHKAVGIAVPVKDTIKVVDEDNFIINTPERKTLWGIQTPQIFDYELITMAHKKAIEDDFIGTDDCVLVERCGSRVKLVEGSYKNIKITTPEDLIIAEALLNTLDMDNYS